MPKEEKAYIALAELYNSINDFDKALEVLDRGDGACGSEQVKNQVQQQENMMRTDTQIPAAETTDANEAILNREKYYSSGVLCVDDYVFFNTNHQLLF